MLVGVTSPSVKRTGSTHSYLSLRLSAPKVISFVGPGISLYSLDLGMVKREGEIVLNSLMNCYTGGLQGMLKLHTELSLVIRRSE